MDYQTIKSHFDYLVQCWNENPSHYMVLANAKITGACIGLLNKACGGEANRKLVLHALTGKFTSRDLSFAEWYALLRFVFHYDVKAKEFIFTNVLGKFEARAELPQWCGMILHHLADQPGQMKLEDVKSEEQTKVEL
jgi:hypothetical protein